VSADGLDPARSPGPPAALTPSRYQVRKADPRLRKPWWAYLVAVPVALIAVGMISAFCGLISELVI
jgi:hypothetical protein